MDEQMKSSGLIQWLPVIILIAYIIFQEQCRGKQPVSAGDGDTTIIHLPDITVNLPPGTAPIIYPQPLPAVIDTGAILRAFYERVEYRDSIETDTLKITLHEFVERNRVIGRTITSQIKLPFTTILPPPEQKMQVYLGMYTTSQLGAGGVISLKTRRDVLYGVGYDPFNKIGMVSAQFKIKLK